MEMFFASSFCIASEIHLKNACLTSFLNYHNTDLPESLKVLLQDMTQTLLSVPQIFLC